MGGEYRDGRWTRWITTGTDCDRGVWYARFISRGAIFTWTSGAMNHTQLLNGEFRLILPAQFMKTVRYTRGEVKIITIIPHDNIAVMEESLDDKGKWNVRALSHQ